MTSTTEPWWRQMASEELRRRGSPRELRECGEPPPAPSKEPYLLYPYPPRYGEDPPGKKTDALFIRFGWIPSYRRSYDRVTGSHEAGMACFKAKDRAGGGGEFVIPEDLSPEKKLEAVKAIVLEIWQDRLLSVVTAARVVEEDETTTWLSTAELRIIPFDLPLFFPGWLPPSAHELTEEWNSFRAAWGPWRDRFARFRSPGIRLILDTQELLFPDQCKTENRPGREQEFWEEMDRQGWRYFDGWGLRVPGAPDDPIEEEDRGKTRTVYSKVHSLDFWRRQGLPDPEPIPADWESVYSRFGDPPEDGERSLCRGFSFHEPGVSVFQGYKSPEGSYYIDFQHSYMLAHWWAMRLMHLQAYVLEGELTRPGVGGEPILNPVTRYEPIPEDVPVLTWPELPENFAENLNNRHDHAPYAETFFVGELLRRSRLDAWPSKPGAPRRLLECGDLAPDPFGPLLDAIFPHASRHAQRSRLHGVHHWRRVWEFGKRLCEETPGADKHVVLLFSVLHDCARDNDGRDPHHGLYAARMAKRLRRDEVFECTDEQFEHLEFALHWHNHGYINTEEDERTIAVCWDADRLDLPRCGRKVDPRYLSTEAAKKMLENLSDLSE